MKTCSKCKEDFPIGTYPNQKSSRDGKNPMCRTCFRQYHRDIYANSKKRKEDIRKNNKKNREAVRSWVREVKLTSGCTDCGYNEHSAALEFDHINDDKEFNVSQMLSGTYSRKRIQEEMDKCEIVCANCHAIRTYQRSHDNAP